MTRLFILSLLLSISISISISTTQLSAQWNPYRDKLDPGSKMLSKGANFTIEKTKDKCYKYKIYYPENKVITKEATSKTKDFKELHGAYVERYDDGEVVVKGHYKEGKKDGVWKDPYGYSGPYISGKRQGKWQVYREGILREELTYIDGQLNGAKVLYDSLGIAIDTLIFELDVLISTTQDTTKLDEQSPRFPGCEHLELSEEEKVNCSTEKLLQYVYGDMKYPMKARRQGIEGKALVRFYIDEEGYVTDVKVLNGLSLDIKKMLLSLINRMPRWRPGEQNGKKVKVQYTLPVKFQLVG